MAKFTVSVDYIEHYQELEIEAKTRAEAEEIYREKIESGEVLSVSGDYVKLVARKKGEPEYLQCANCGVVDKDVTGTEVVVSDTGAKFDVWLCDNCRENDYGEVNNE